MSATGSEESAEGAKRPVSRSPDESRAIMTTPVLPADTNSYGNIFGGHLVALIDKVASISAFRHARRNVVTASIDRVDFLRPVLLGDILTLEARLNRVGHSSMEIEVEATTEDRLSGASSVACTAWLTFVAVNDDGRPISVPGLELTCEEERQRERDARTRAEKRQRHDRP